LNKKEEKEADKCIDY